MNEEIIKKLIQLTPEQQALLDVVEQSLRALCESGVNLFYDFEDYSIRAINLNAFKVTEAEDARCETDYHNNGFVTIPYWEGKAMSNYTCFMCTDDYLYGEIKQELLNHDKNLFNE